MILLKGFLNYKSSKKYIVIFVFLLLTISTILNVAEYNSTLVTNIYQNNSYFLVTSNNNIFEEITANKSISEIKK